MPTHPSHGHGTDTLANALAYYFSKQKQPFVFRAVNRLDRTTSGVVLVAKNRFAAHAFQKALSADAKKEYIAVICGTPEKPVGIIDKNIKRAEKSIIFRCVCDSDEGKTARTEYTVIKSFRKEEHLFSLVSLYPITGRTHQLRVHCLYMGTPICGDGLYGGTELSLTENPNRPLLHAARLTVRHPFTGDEITFSAPLPEDMQIFLSGTEKI